MKQGTTPTIPLTVKDHDLSGCRVYVAFRNGRHLLEKTNEDMTVTYADPDTILAVRLTQEETLQFSVGTIQVDVRWVNESGEAWGTDIATLNVSEAILKRVIDYAD